jgi:hypothetical protein
MNRVWINLEKRRYYRAVVQRDLLGDWIFVRIWGSLDSNLGQVRIEVVESEEVGYRMITTTHKRRLERGYQSTHN